jgi:hypothetical protein
MDHQYNPYVYAGYGADVSLPPGCAEVCNPADASTFEGEATCDANCVGWRTMFQPPAPPVPNAAPCSETCNPNASGSWMGEVFCNANCPDWRSAFGCPPGSVVDPGDPRRCIPSGINPPVPAPPKPPKPPKPPVVTPPAAPPEVKKMGIFGWSAIGAGLLLLVAAASAAKKKGAAPRMKKNGRRRTRRARRNSR